MEKGGGLEISRPEDGQEMATRVGDEVIKTRGTREEHTAAVHEATLKLRTPEQIAEIEKKRPEFAEAVRRFQEEVLKNFEETGDSKKAIDGALFEVFRETLRSEDDL